MTDEKVQWQRNPERAMWQFDVLKLDASTARLFANDQSDQKRLQQID